MCQQCETSQKKGYLQTSHLPNYRTYNLWNSITHERVRERERPTETETGRDRERERERKGNPV